MDCRLITVIFIVVAEPPFFEEWDRLASLLRKHRSSRVLTVSRELFC